MGESLVRTPQSEVTATLEALSAQGVLQEDLKRLRGGIGSDFRQRIAGQLLGISHASFLTSPTGSYDVAELEARWARVDEALIGTARKLHHVTLECHNGVGFGAFMAILDKCHEFFGFEFLIWQAVCEMMYQVGHSIGELPPGTAGMIRRMIACMERLPEYSIGCHEFKYMLPAECRAHFSERKALELVGEVDLAFAVSCWGATRMRTLQLVVNRYLYWAED